MPDIAIVGAGGHGREVLDIVEALIAAGHSYSFVGFIDDHGGDTALLSRRGAGVVSSTADPLPDGCTYVVGIGDGSARARLAQVYGSAAATLVHPLASVASDNILGPGVVLAAGARVTTNVHLGAHTHLNVNAVVSHDCRLGQACTLSPGTMLNGNVTVGDGAFFGTNAVVTPGITVGARAVIGAGAVVIHDVPDDATVVGVPARRVDR